MNKLFTKEQYKKYLSSPHWKQVRKRALTYAGNRCQLCGANKNLEVHHNTYERIGDEAPRDLIVLCSDCHKSFHGINKNNDDTLLRRNIFAGFYAVVQSEIDYLTFASDIEQEVAYQHSPDNPIERILFTLNRSKSAYLDRLFPTQ